MASVRYPTLGNTWYRLFQRIVLMNVKYRQLLTLIVCTDAYSLTLS